MTTTRMQTFTCPGCDSAFGDMPLDGSYLRIGNAIIRHDIELTCGHCQRLTTWHAPRPAVTPRRNRPRKKHGAAPLLVLVELAA